MTNQQRVSGLPSEHYIFPRQTADYFFSQYGIVVGHQGFDNNILMAEAYMKVLPQLLYAKEIGMLNNRFSHSAPVKELNRTAINRVYQIWNKGLQVVIKRDPEQPQLIVYRRVMYPLYGKQLIKVHGTIEEFFDVYEVMVLCPFCKSTIYGLVHDRDLLDFPQHGVFVCSECDYEEECEIETKPSLQMIAPKQPINTNPVWVNIRGEIPVRYGLENVSLDTLKSNQGGFYDPEKVGLTVVKKPRYTSVMEIYESTKTTDFPSQKYFQYSMKTIFGDWLHYYNILLMDGADLLGQSTMPIFARSGQKRQRIE